MKKLAIVAVAAFVCIGTTPVSAQSYAGVYGTGNIAPNVTADNPSGSFQYPYSAESGLSALAQAPASKALAQQGAKGIRHRNQSELARSRFKYDRDAGQHGITPHYYRPYYYGHYGYYGPWPP